MVYRKQDLIQEGNIGLMKAVKRFNPGVGVRLVSLLCIGLKQKFMSMCCGVENC